MKDPFHDGERAVQSRAGVTEMAARIGNGLHDAIPDASRVFLAQQRLIFLGAADERGSLWAAALAGEPGFAVAEDEHVVRLSSSLRAGDALDTSIVPGKAVGLLAIEFATRRRMRLNGTVRDVGAGCFRIAAREVFGNCPKYIQRRELPPGVATEVLPAEASRATSLSPSQEEWIAGADTFLIATAHPDAGTDVSHRGGNPGFVRVLDRRTLLWPDYIGNMMFQTLGNLAVNPAAGLLFLDFETGSTLQLSGKAVVLWDDPRAADLPGAQRLVRFAIEHLVENRHALAGPWRFIDRSPHNPA